ncbi:MAG: DUF5659 domain-containing protein [Elusimicrobiota bacterium]
MKNDDHAAALFPVSDFYAAAFLICAGLELVRTERVNVRRVVFLLRDKPQRMQMIQDFYAHKSKVDPLAYKDSIVNLKALIHGLRPEGANRYA